MKDGLDWLDQTQAERDANNRIFDMEDAMNKDETGNAAQNTADVTTEIGAAKADAVVEVEAGRELDALIAERVFGTKCRFERGVETAWQNGAPIMWSPNDYIILNQSGVPEPCVYLPSRMHSYLLVPHYSTDIAAAWEIINKLREGFEWCCIDLHSNFHYEWRVTMIEYVENAPDDYKHEPTIEATADTAPLAICRAALKAVAAQEAT